MKIIILRKVSQDADIKCIFGTTISGIKLAQIVKIFMHRASTMFYLHYRAVLNLHGRYVLLHFNEITHCYCFGTHTQINGMPRGSCRVLRRSAASFYSLLIVPRYNKRVNITRALNPLAITVLYKLG